MSNTHQDKYMSKLLIGLAFVTVGIFVIMYGSLNANVKKDWYFWGISAAVAINVGLIFVGSAYVHKIKSDLIRRQKKKEQHKTFTSD